VFAIIEDDGDAISLLTRPEIILFSKSIKTAGYSDEGIHPVDVKDHRPLTAFDKSTLAAPRAHSFTDKESMIAARIGALRAVARCAPRGHRPAPLQRDGKGSLH
jgi:hypothetical protein